MSRPLNILGGPGRLGLGLLLALTLAGLGAASRAALAPRVKNPHGSFKEDCALCHGADAWKPAKMSPRFDHAKYGFALSGAHAAADCASCHASLDFSQERSRCASCHEDPHRGEMGDECARCHGSRSFIDRSGMLRAHQLSHFPLTGSHSSLECASCHRPAAQGQMQFVGTQAECKACHMEDYRRAPNHVTGSFPLECATCHTTFGWARARFDHAVTGFPLTGAHSSQACATCHGTGGFTGLSADCVSCHRSNYDATTSPNHASAGYSTACQTCHDTSRWQNATFDHNATAFPLTGAHTTASCNSCHGDGVFAGKNTDCVSCHRSNYDATTSPNHASAGYSTACQTCHDTSRWQNATFDHNATAFPLTGAHTAAACSSCHGDGVFAGKNTDCVSCHRANYDATTDPNHAAAGLGLDCQSCHGTSGWQGAMFASHDSDFFPIYSGVHAGRWSDCATCHIDPARFSPFTCFSCHPHDDQPTTDGHHSGVSGYSYDSQACYSCHPNGTH